MSKEKKLEDALLKRALGCNLKECKEEYELRAGEMVLTKRKVHKKAYPPEVAALKLLLETLNDKVEMSEEELRVEKERLLRELKKAEEEK